MKGMPKPMKMVQYTGNLGGKGAMPKKGKMPMPAKGGKKGGKKPCSCGM